MAHYQQSVKAKENLELSNSGSSQKQEADTNPPINVLIQDHH